MKRMIALVSCMLVLATANGCRRSPDAPPKLKNVVLMVGDGMGVASITAARVLYGIEQGIDPPESARLYMDTMPETGLVRTYSADRRVTDSAASMTAMMTGQRCCNYVLGMDATTDYKDERGDGDGATLVTLLEIAESMGKATGVVTTTRVTHATPAACYAHVNDRWREQEIAEQLIGNPALGDGLEVVLGGGRRSFEPAPDDGELSDMEGTPEAVNDRVDVLARLVERGYVYVEDRAGLAAVDASATERLLGLFDDSHMEYEIDRRRADDPQPALAEMAMKAVEILAADPDGYFLMVEGGRIDHALHDGQARRAMVEVIAFDEAVRAVASRVDLEDTLILVTGDHDHTMVIGGAPPLASPAVTLGGTDENGVPYMSILFGVGPGRMQERTAPPVGASEDPDYVHESAVPRRSGSHGGNDLALYAIGGGPYAQWVSGTHDNTALFDIMLAAFEGREALAAAQKP